MGADLPECGDGSREVAEFRSAPAQVVAGHLGVGFGAHQCLGAAPARLEMDVAFTALAARLPGLRLAVPLEDVPFRSTQFVYGLDSLPVTW